MKISKSLIENIQSQINIVELIQNTVELKKRGSNYVGLCPFHQEKTPSFTVNQTKGLFYCFGCSESGNSFQFLMKYHRYTFPEAVKFLAKSLGINIDSSQDKKLYDLNTAILEIYKHSHSYYHKNLLTIKSNKAQNYCTKRKLNTESIVNFKLGYADSNWQSLKDFLSEKKYSEKEQLSSSMISKSKNKIFDYFRNRLIFPIFDENNRVIAFGARVLDNSLPKYINSKENYFFQKRKILYGLNNAKKFILEKKHVIIVEGYIDVIISHQMGIKNCVATLGTGLTQEHIQKLSRYTNTLVLIFDSDNAGKKASLIASSKLINANLKTKIVLLTNNDDPYDHLIKYGKESLYHKILSSKSALEYRLSYGFSLNLENKIIYLQQVYLFISNLESEVLKEDSFTYISKLTKTPLKAIKKDYQQFIYKLKNKNKNKNQITKKSDKTHSSEQYLLFTLINNPNLCKEVNFKMIITYISNSFYKEIFNQLSKSYKEDSKISLDNLVKDLDSNKKDWLLKESFNPQYYNSNSKVIIDCIKKLKISNIKRQKSILKERFKKIKGNEKEEEKFLEEGQFLANEETKINNMT